MASFEVLCVTMHQKDFSKIKEMNIRSDVVFANQCDRTDYAELEFDGHTAKMISTNTRGVGINRNLSLMYASADIVLLSDEDMRYTDTYEEDIVKAFEQNPKADVMIFNIGVLGSERKQKQNLKTQKTNIFSRMPYGAPRIAMRLDAWKKSNVWFTLLFGGGAKFTNGEDSIFINQLRRAGLDVYVSNVYIGDVDMSDSCWYGGGNQEFFFNKGAYLQAMHPKKHFVWRLYFALRTRNSKNLSVKQKIEWMKKGKNGYKNFNGFDNFN